MKYVAYFNGTQLKSGMTLAQYNGNRIMGFSRIMGIENEHNYAIRIRRVKSFDNDAGNKIPLYYQFRDKRGYNSSCLDMADMSMLEYKLWEGPVEYAK